MAEQVHISRKKYMLIFNIHDAPILANEWSAIDPYRVEVSIWDTKARVTVTGRSRYGIRSMIFDLYGYDKNAECPKWLAKVLREAGYVGAIRGRR